ncbi:MAG: M14 family zinc carboxypeptidase, partial [Planctomycetota bacterium]
MLCGCATPSFTRVGMGSSVEGRPVEAFTIGAGPMVLVVAGIHGNEQAGIPLAHRLMTLVTDDPSLLAGHRLVVVPVMNPDGVDANIRTNARGVDLNRNWPAGNRKELPKSGSAPLSEPESAALHALIAEYEPIRVLTIHQPLDCVDYDGPAADLAAAIADATGLPVKKLGGRPGSMGTHLGVERGVPIITLELPRSADK